MNKHKKISSAVVYGIALLCLVSIQLSFASSCKLYEDANYKGDKIKIHKDEKLNYVGKHMNDRASSIKVPDGCKLVTFEHADFKGHKQVFRSNASFVGNQTNDSISSAKCKCNSLNNNDSYNNSSSNHDNNASQCVLYTDANYQGQTRLIKKNREAKFVGNRLNDKASSIKVPGGCELIAFEDADFRGHKQVFRSNTDYVGNRTNDSISSARCKCGSSNNNGSSSYDNNHHSSNYNDVNQCILYSELNYRGRNILIDKNKERSYVGDKVNDKISSVKVPSNCKLIVYEDANFRGNETVFRDTLSFVGKRWDNRISSAECRCGKY